MYVRTSELLPWVAFALLLIIAAAAAPLFPLWLFSWPFFCSSQKGKQDQEQDHLDFHSKPVSVTCLCQTAKETEPEKNCVVSKQF